MSTDCTNLQVPNINDAMFGAPTLNICLHGRTAPYLGNNVSLLPSRNSVRVGGSIFYVIFDLGVEKSFGASWVPEFTDRVGFLFA